MPTPKLFIRQYQIDGKTYQFYRYWDNHLNNYEYQVYELVIAKKVARTLGAPDINDRNADQNSRQMCDWVWNNVPPSDGEYK